jgi:LDH2 family malate/lactate/ureidoglycolate dehydrogenase
MTKTARGITIDNELWGKIQEQSKKENRPISNFIETILRQFFEELDKDPFIKQKEFEQKVNEYIRMKKDITVY